ncbi:hypothetical protein [Streptomyces sp. NPDC002790]|uniref:hypothetical protein n=1 Tax=Streptomyces sp. NPDC002790 TaxID=3154431 RepID=UPI00331F1F76
MAEVGQLPDRVRDFAAYLRGLNARLDQRAGWCGVFWRRDPEGMRACLDGSEVPPWDVVEALLKDLAATLGTEHAEREAARAHALYRASARVHDTGPGGRALLADRMDVMARERRYAARRLQELGARLGSVTDQEEADAVRIDLAWAHDDHERATARLAELGSRLDELGPDPALSGSTPAAAPTPAPTPTPAKARKRRPRGSARFAGMAMEEAETREEPEPGSGAATGSAPSPAPATPTGARFAGAAPGRDEVATPAPPSVDATAYADVADTVALLARHRAGGHSGEAHMVLVGAAAGPATHFPLLADELTRSGLGADWATLLWEAGALPLDRLVAAADALVAAGRTGDGQALLRQGTGSPPTEFGAAVRRLDAASRHREVRTLLDAYVRGRTPEEAAHSARDAPDRLVPLLLDAARQVSEERYWDLCTHCASRASRTEPSPARVSVPPRSSGLPTMPLASPSMGLTFVPLRPFYVRRGVRGDVSAQKTTQRRSDVET